MNERFDRQLYVLDFLRQPLTKDAWRATCSYRLICSGLILASNDMTYGSGSPLVLLTKPFELLSATDKYGITDYAYPQELSLTFRIPVVQPKDFNGWWPPSDELAHDISALLSLFTRRLITVAGCVKLAPEQEPGSDAETMIEFPFPIATQLKSKYWPMQSPTMVVWPNKPPTDFKSYMPQILGFNREFFTKLLAALPSLSANKEIVLAARLYSLAMSLVHDDTDIAYFLMTMAIESMANKVIQHEEAKAVGETDFPSEFVAACDRMGLTAEQRRELFMAAKPPDPKARYKFLKFVEDYCIDRMWEPDDLFHIAKLRERIIPPKKELRKAADEIYKQRSAFAHRGVPYSPSISLGLRSMSHYSTVNELMNPKGCFPPFPFVERLTHLCIVAYWLEQADALTNSCSKDKP